MPSGAGCLACAITLLALTLGGCAIQPGSGLSATQARTQFYTALDQTEAAVGGTWDVQDDPTARGCVIPLLVEGVKFPGLRIGSAPRDPQVAITEVSSMWSAWGYSVVRTRVGSVMQLQGSGARGDLLLFRVSENAMTLQGESECRPKGA